MHRTIHGATLELVQGDITRQAVDALVNAANSQLQVGGGVDGAIHRAGGMEINHEARRKYPQGCPVGEAVITSAGNLPAKYVIHAVGPIWQGGQQGEEDRLRSAYTRSLELAVAHGCESIAFPALSTGVFGYPLDRAARASLRAIIDFLDAHGKPPLVRVVLFGEGAYGAFAAALDELLPTEA